MGFPRASSNFLCQTPPRRNGGAKAARAKGENPIMSAATRPAFGVLIALAMFGLAGCMSTYPAAGPQKRIVLVRSTRPLEVGGGDAAFVLVKADPNRDEVESVYGPCIGVDADSYAWQSGACADPVRQRFGADYALFLSPDSLALADLQSAKIVRAGHAPDTDWGSSEGVGKTITRLIGAAQARMP